MALANEQLSSILVDSGLLTAEQFATAVNDAQGRGEPIERSIVDLGYLDNSQIGKVMADAYGVPFIDLRRVKPNPEAVRAIPEIVAKHKRALCYGWDKDVRLLAMVDPLDLVFAQMIEKKTGDPIRIGYTTPSMLEDAITSYSKDVVGQIQQLTEKFAARATVVGRPAEEDETTVRVMDLILKSAYDNNTSDVHIEPREHESLVRFRVDGLLHDVVKLPKAMQDMVVSRVKILSNLRTDEHFTAQDGKFRVRLAGETVDVRVSVVPIVEGEKIVMRLLSERGRALTLETLGLEGADLERVKVAVDKPYGMILATGPTGSGKTTTMYAVLKILNTRDVNISTIEDPVEYDIEGVNQIQVNARTGLTFASGLRSIVRQDPDIVMVGEIRDAETAGIAVNAAMTGHLVLSTLHTNDAATALPRLLDMDVQPFLIASSVNLIIAQRLVRKICPSCIVSIEVDTKPMRAALPPELFKKYFGTKTKARVFKGKGCNACHQTGYTGRLGIYEVMAVSTRIQEMIMSRTNANLIAQEAMREGMTTMLEDGLKKIMVGVTSMEEVLRVVR